MTDNIWFLITPEIRCHSEHKLYLKYILYKAVWLYLVGLYLTEWTS